MSLAYLTETVGFLETRGFTVAREEIPLVRGGVTVHLTRRFQLERGPNERLMLSCVQYPTGQETYWLEIVDHHGLRAGEFELDSWKHRADRIEFKFYAREDGVGLSFVLSLPGA